MTLNTPHVAQLVAEPTEKNLYTLHDMRKNSGISGKNAAELCNTSYQSLRNWENGANIPNIVNIQELLAIYGYTLEQLDLSPFYKEANNRTCEAENDNTNLALQRLNEFRRQYAPDAT